MPYRVRLAGAVGWILAAIVLRPSLDAEPREMLRIVTVRSIPTSTGLEHTNYILLDQRREEFPRIGGEPMAVIARCDRDSYSYLNLETRTYFTRSLSGSRPPDLPPLPAGFKKPVLLVETSTIDTGERRTFFGYTARHVITTRKETLPDAKPTVPTELRKDGWYIDLNTHISCSEHAFFDVTDDDAALSGRTLMGNVYEPVFRHTGPRERGYPVEEHRTYRHSFIQPDGRSQQDVSFWSIRMTDLSFDPYDPALFEIPRDFRPTPSSGSTPSLWIRLRNAWYWLQQLVFEP